VCTRQVGRETCVHPCARERVCVKLCAQGSGQTDAHLWGPVGKAVEYEHVRQRIKIAQGGLAVEEERPSREGGVAGFAGDRGGRVCRLTRGADWVSAG
jgi:hypothetical protein